MAVEDDVHDGKQAWFDKLFNDCRDVKLHEWPKNHVVDVNVYRWIVYTGLVLISPAYNYTTIHLEQHFHSVNSHSAIVLKLCYLRLYTQPGEFIVLLYTS